ncbi:MAG: YraN family protein [Bacteroidales bacterium]
MAESHLFGSASEKIAARFLIAKGYRLLHMNWKYMHKELDIICTNEELLVVAEVKARQQNYFPHPEDIISRSKERFILEAAEFYIQRFGIKMPVRFDLILIINHDKLIEIEHLEDAIIPGVE